MQFEFGDIVRLDGELERPVYSRIDDGPRVLVAWICEAGCCVGESRLDPRAPGAAQRLSDGPDRAMLLVSILKEYGEWSLLTRRLSRDEADSPKKVSR